MPPVSVTRWRFAVILVATPTVGMPPQTKKAAKPGGFAAFDLRTSFPVDYSEISPTSRSSSSRWMMILGVTIIMRL